VGTKGDKPEKNNNHGRRSSSITSMDQLGFDLSDLMSDFDRNSCYQRIFRRDGCTAGNLLVQDTQFMDAVRCFMENGGLSRKVILPNIVKWRHMLQSAAGGDEPYNLFEDVRIVDAQWVECCMCLPNSVFPKYSFSCVYYDATVKIDSEKLSHKALRVVQPKEDIAKVFERQIIMNGGYFIIAVSRKGVEDDGLHALVNNIHKHVHVSAKEHGYKVKRIAMGIHNEQMVFVDFRVFRRYVPRNKKEGRQAMENKKARYHRRQEQNNTTNGNKEKEQNIEEEHPKENNFYFYYYAEEEEDGDHMHGYYDYYDYYEDGNYDYEDDDYYYEDEEEHYYHDEVEDDSQDVKHDIYR
jgi:hypothetical protein